MIGEDRAFQGNLDPAVLLADENEMHRQTEAIFHQIGNRPGFIFNLGHGVHQQTPVENVVKLVKIVHGE